MALANHNTFARLSIGFQRRPIVGRLLRTWDARNITQNKFMGIVLLFVDEDKSVINGFIKADLAATFSPILTESSIYTLQNFDVARCNTHHKITGHQFIINFLPCTNITLTPACGKPIVYDKFMLRPVEHLKLLANTHLEYPDVVGRIRMVQGTKFEDYTSTERLIVHFQINMTETWLLELWDDAASTFRWHLSHTEDMNAIMIVTTVNPCLFGGKYCLYSTDGTRFYFDKNNEDIQFFSQRLSIGTDLSFKCEEEITLKDLKIF